MEGGKVTAKLFEDGKVHHPLDLTVRMDVNQMGHITNRRIAR